MSLRIASIAFLLATVSVGIAWLSLQPLLVRLFALAAANGQTASVLEIRRTLPWLLGLDLLLVAGFAFLVLQLTVSRALRRTERAIEELGRVEAHDALPFARAGGGALVARVERAVARVLDALRREQSTTQRQLRELTEANLRLKRTQTELVGAERLATVGRLAAGVAHEVGNPLSGILGYLSLARSRERDPQVSDFLVRIEAEVQRIDQIVRGLLNLGRPASSTSGAVELRAVIEACVQLLRKAPELSEVEIATQVGEDAIAIGESGGLSQVLINLLLNAGQAMDGKGRIQVSAAREGDRVLLRVMDDGPGVPDAILPQIFDPFFSTKPEGRGTGLGLAVSQNLVVAMGGRLTAENRPGGGACFTVALRAA